MAPDLSKPYRGEEIDGHQAAVSSGLSPGPLRYLFRSSGSRIAFGCAVPCLLLMVAAGTGGHKLWRHDFLLVNLLGVAIMGVGVLSGLIALILALIGFLSYRIELQHYRDGLLVPGVITSVHPTVVVVLADMGRTVPGSRLWPRSRRVPSGARAASWARACPSS